MVSLSKNQTVSLSKQSTVLSQLQFGLGWDPVKKKGLFGSIFGGNDSIDWMQVAFFWMPQVIKLTPSGFVN